MTRIETDVRVPTGVVQFGEDWPGVFIRGDEALALAQMLSLLPELGLSKKYTDDGSMIGGLIQTLRSCRKD